jgi:PadR family transcriptional regulator PadR
MSEHTWPSEWLRGVLEACVLRVLDDGATYGYALAERLEELGLGRLKGGTLYPLLGRMEAAGLVTVEWRAGASGPGRKYYELTDTGRDALADQTTRWTAFTTTTRAILGPQEDR